LDRYSRAIVGRRQARRGGQPCLVMRSAALDRVTLRVVWISFPLSSFPCGSSAANPLKCSPRSGPSQVTMSGGGFAPNEQLFYDPINRVYYLRGALPNPAAVEAASFPHQPSYATTNPYTGAVALPGGYPTTYAVSMPMAHGHTQGHAPMAVAQVHAPAPPKPPSLTTFDSGVESSGSSSSDWNRTASAGSLGRAPTPPRDAGVRGVWPEPHLSVSPDLPPQPTRPPHAVTDAMRGQWPAVMSNEMPPQTVSRVSCSSLRGAKRCRPRPRVLCPACVRACEAAARI
jgi:hypothetical protein